MFYAINSYVFANFLNLKCNLLSRVLITVIIKIIHGALQLLPHKHTFCMYLLNTRKIVGSCKWLLESVNKIMKKNPNTTHRKSFINYRKHRICSFYIIQTYFWPDQFYVEWTNFRLEPLNVLWKYLIWPPQLPMKKLSIWSPKRSLNKLLVWGPQRPMKKLSIWPPKCSLNKLVVWASQRPMKKLSIWPPKRSLNKLVVWAP